MWHHRGMDPRVARTRTGLQRALFDLAGERPLDDVTIADITDRAGVNRSSFYQHYSDKDSLLADAIESVLDAAAAPLRQTLAAQLQPGMPAELDDYLRHVASHLELYRRVLGPHGSGAVGTRLRSRIELIVRDTFEAAGDRSFGDVPLDVVSAGIAGMVLGVIAAWVRIDPLPEVEVASAWLEQVLAAPGQMLARSGA